jgi:hypothetical protein
MTRAQSNTRKKSAESRGSAKTRTTRAAMVARNGPTESARVEEDMWALVFYSKKDGWDKSKGLRNDRVPKPKQNEDV